MAFTSTTVSVGGPTEANTINKLQANDTFLYSSTLSFTGEKTFRSATVFESTVAVTGVTTQTGGVAQSIIGVSSTMTVFTKKEKYLDIGPWNMVSVTAVDVDHGLQASNIISVTGIVRSDDGVWNYPIPGFESDGTVAVYAEYWNDTKIEVQRNTGGLVYNDLFTSTSLNRGILIVVYKD